MDSQGLDLCGRDTVVESMQLCKLTNNTDNNSSEDSYLCDCVCILSVPVLVMLFKTAVCKSC